MPRIYSKDGEDRFVHAVDLGAWLANGWAIAPIKPPPPSKPKLNLNTADPQELTPLPGIGPTTAKRIVELRDRLGKFESLEQLREIPRVNWDSAIAELANLVEL